MATKLDQRIKELEQRVAALEKPVARKSKRGWLKLAGWAQDDSVYDEALKLGAKWRKSS